MLSRELRRIDICAKRAKADGNKELALKYLEEHRIIIEKEILWREARGGIYSYLHCINNAEGEIPGGIWQMMYDEALPKVLIALDLIENELYVDFMRSFKKLKADIKRRNSSIEQKEQSSPSNPPDPFEEAQSLVKRNHIMLEKLEKL